MNEDIDFDDYPTLHLHMMIDDYEDLCRQIDESHKPVNEEYTTGEELYKGIDPQGRFSFCFAD